MKKVLCGLLLFNFYLSYAVAKNDVKVLFIQTIKGYADSYLVLNRTSPDRIKVSRCPLQRRVTREVAEEAVKKDLTTIPEDSKCLTQERLVSDLSRAIGAKEYQSMLLGRTTSVPTIGAMVATLMLGRQIYREPCRANGYLIAMGGTTALAFFSGIYSSHHLEIYEFIDRRFPLGESIPQHPQGTWEDLGNGVFYTEVYEKQEMYLNILWDYHYPSRQKSTP